MTGGIFDACPEPAEGAAIRLKRPPHFEQAVMSNSKTRLRSCAHLTRVCAERAGSAVGSSEGSAGGVGLFRDDLRAEGRVGGEDAVEADEMKPGRRDQGSQALQEFQGRHEDMRGAIAARGFEFQDDVSVWCTSQPFVTQGGMGDVATESFEGGALMGS